MKKTRQFLPLLKLMLGFYRYGPIPLFLWFLSYGIGLYFAAGSWREDWVGGVDHGQFAAGLFGPTITLWLFLMLVSTPLPVQLLGGPTSLEFLFTRAIDPWLWLRTERVAIIIISASPLVVDLAVAPRESKMFAGWLLWAALVIIFLVAGYFSIVFTAWQQGGWHHSKSAWRPWLGGVMVNAPAFGVIPVLLIFATLKINIYEQSYLFFTHNTLLCVVALAVLIAVVQPLSERNIRKLEFEFT